MTTNTTTAVSWLSRLSWIGLAVVAPNPIERWLTDSGAPTWVSWTVWGFTVAVWSVGVVALVFPSVVTLTITRVLVPFVAAATGTLAVANPDVWSVASCGLAVVATLGVSSADLGRQYVQASAYGHEERFILRPPPVYLTLCAISWAAATIATITAAGLLVGRPIVALLVGVFATAAWAWGWRRWHRLSRRWAVVVPAGLVLHDHVVLAETAMISRTILSQIAAVPVATDQHDSGAYDLTGGAQRGHVEITTSETVTVLLAATPSKPSGTAIHLNAAVIAPSRPGLFVRAMRSATPSRG